MIKLFFKSMCMGIRTFYEETRPIILLLMFLGTPTIIVGFIGKIFPQCKDYLIIFAIIGCILGFSLLCSYVHFKDAINYSKEHDVSFEEAWKETKANDCDEW
jgi:ABC-type transport system involved in cytochrome c biogenesis permease subunit